MSEISLIQAVLSQLPSEPGREQDMILDTAEGRDARPLGFRQYYHREFRGDLAAVMLHGTRCPTSPEPSLNPRAVSMENPEIARMPERRRTHFAIALYLTVLTDQVAYTWFATSYARFRALTMYPKWHGDCPGGCHHHAHPESILRAVGARPGADLSVIPHQRHQALRQALPELRLEVESFVAEHMPELGAEFRQRCMAEAPLAGLQRERQARLQDATNDAH